MPVEAEPGKHYACSTACAEKAQQNYLADWEEKTNRFLRYARGVVHIGAHEGQEAEYYASLGLPVLWVEALSEAYWKLRANIAQYPNQVAYLTLLDSGDGKERKVGIANNGGQSSSIFELGRHKEVWPEVAYDRYLSLTATRFDTLVTTENIDLSPYNALIMDVQAAELLVLQGMRYSLDHFDWIRCECADFEIYKGGCQLKDLDEYLLARGYVKAEAHVARTTPGIGSCYEVLYAKPEAAELLKPRERVIPQPKDRAKPNYVNPLMKDRERPDWKPGLTSAVSEIVDKALAPAQRSLQKAIDTLGGDPGPFVRIAAAMSSPRLGFLDNTDAVVVACMKYNISYSRAGGCWWHHALTDLVARAVKEKTDYVLTIDYDTAFHHTDIAKLVCFLDDNPHIDVAVPLQQKREGGELLATTIGDLDFTQPGIPILCGHFGLTLFRTSMFEKLSKPWFWERHAPDGSWGPGRIDADMGFWTNCANHGVNVYLVLTTVVGHLELVNTYPDQDLNPYRITINEWHKGDMVAPAQAFTRARGIETNEKVKTLEMKG